MKLSHDPPFVRKTISLDVDLRDLLVTMSKRETMQADHNISMSRIANEMLMECNFKNLEKFTEPDDATEIRNRLTLMFEQKVVDKIYDALADRIKTCAINYCGEPSFNFSRTVNNALRKQLKL